MKGQGQWEYHQKTIVPNARPSVESIVEPYKVTVLQMLSEGKNHRNIYPVIVQEGFKGSSNAIYQYIIKYSHENGISYGVNARAIPLEERKVNSIIPRPPKIIIERASKQTIYESLLHAAATAKEDIKQSLLGLESRQNDSESNTAQSNSAEWVNKTNYTDSIAEIIFDTKQKNKNVKKN